VRRRLLAIAALLVVLLAGVAVAIVIELRERPSTGLDTELEDVTVVQGTDVEPPARRPPRRRRDRYRFLPKDQLCWPVFGRDTHRSIALKGVHLGPPKRPFWVRGLKSYIEYPPSYCDGVVYVNSYKGVTYALNAHNGRVIWRRSLGGKKASTPAIAGPRLIVSSLDGTVTAYRRRDGRVLWQFRVRAQVESSPVVVDGLVYFGATDGRLFAVHAGTGRVRWAYDTGGKITASPSVLGRRVCITNYAGAITCLRRRSGSRLWVRYVRRDFLRYESFYASASTDGRRLFTIARSGKVVALSARSGRILWTKRLRTLGYSTPAVAYGRIFVGDFNGYLHAYVGATGAELWRRRVPGRILGPAVVVGKLVFFSTLETRTYAARIRDGRIVWRIGIGKYSPGIATERHYFFTLNGLVVAYRGTYQPKVGVNARKARRTSRKRRMARRP
jgi:outer membrane protein assembly factor BamB